MDFHVITPSEEQLVVRTEDGRVIQVRPAPLSSLPGRVTPPPQPGQPDAGD